MGKNMKEKKTNLKQTNTHHVHNLATRCVIVLDQIKYQIRDKLKSRYWKLMNESTANMEADPRANIALQRIHNNIK